ncbi:MAG: C39 family peptidase [Nitrospirota bacterium]
MKKSSQLKLLLILILIISILLGLIWIAPKLSSYFERRSIDSENIKTMELIEKEDVIVKKITPSMPSDEAISSPPIPNKAYLEVPFVCQAPLETEANWVFHEESCEEAALLMAYLYETGQTITKEEANIEILDMLEWQKTNWNGHYDIYAKDVSKLAQGFYGIKEYEIEIINDATLDDIKEQIAGGYPVIAPVTSDYLDNPYYPYPGYHMLIVIGYTEDKIITNDNGTKRGEDFSYDNEKFKKALDDAGGDIVILKLSSSY